MQPIGHFFDQLEHGWESLRSQKLQSTLLVGFFIASLILIDINRSWDILPELLATHLPTNHLVAIEWVFTLLLFFEVLGLCLSLAHSVAISVGKQFEILSLILLRDTFKELSYFSEPLVWSEVQHSMGDIIATASGAILIFVILSFYYRAQQHPPITHNPDDRASFVLAKKLISLALIISFVLVLIDSALFYLSGSDSKRASAFETFYTLLIFSDILIVLLSLRYSSNFHITFRNSGFAVATVMIRLALIAPVMLTALIGVGTAIFAVGLTYAYNYFHPMSEEEW